MPSGAFDSVPGFRQLSLARRARVLGLAALQRIFDERPRIVASLFDRTPEPIRNAIRALAAPVRIERESKAARLDPKAAVAEMRPRRTAPSTGTPSVSIVIPTQGSGDWLDLCLASVVAHTDRRSYEIVVVDDGAPDAARVAEIVRRHPRTTLLSLSPSQGFAGAVNAGVERAATDRLVILNDDAVVTPGWLDTLLTALEQRENVGLVGPASNDTGDRATVPAKYDSLAGLLDVARRADGEPVEVDKLSLFCALVPRAAFESVGGLDEDYGSGMFEDDELCMALRARGLSVLLAPAAFVHHAAGATLRRRSAFDYMARFEVNRRRFERRWKVRWRAPHVRP